MAAPVAPETGEVMPRAAAPLEDVAVEEELEPLPEAVVELPLEPDVPEEPAVWPRVGNGELASTSQTPEVEAGQAKGVIVEVEAV